jgi:Uma2 family endonuclease
MDSEVLPEPLSYEEERGKPMPSLNHGIVQANLGVEFMKHREFRVASEVTLSIGGKSYTPDLILIPRQAVNWHVDPPKQTEVPPLVVEIFSPMQGAQEIMDKVAIYLAHGVKSCWVVSPPLHTVKIMTADGREEVHHHGVITDPVLGMSADLDAVFS